VPARPVGEVVDPKIHGVRRFHDQTRIRITIGFVLGVFLLVVVSVILLVIIVPSVLVLVSFSSICCRRLRLRERGEGAETCALELWSHRVQALQQPLPVPPSALTGGGGGGGRDGLGEVVGGQEEPRGRKEGPGVARHEAAAGAEAQRR
jgi:hypothetical protein